MRNLFAIAVLLLSCLSAYAQAPTITELPPLSGAPIGSGYSAANGTLFAAASASLNSASFPFTVSYDAITPTNGGSFVNTGTNTTGFALSNNTTFGDTYHLGGQIRPASGFSTSLCTTGKMCWRGQLDSVRHHYCWVWQSNHAYFYLDGILRDELSASIVGSYTPSTSLWQVASNGLPANATIFDFRVANTAWPADECVRVSRLNQAGLIPNSGIANTNLLVSLPLNNCVTTGLEVTCADASGNGNNFANAKQPPVVVVTAPSPGTLPPGNVSMTATCTDPSATTCTQVCYLVDNVQVSASCPTVAPYTFSWDSTKIIDGVHTITAVGFNIAGTTGTSAGVSITTANGISPKTVWINSSTGSDSNNCLSSGAACLTFAHVRSAITFLGGDTFNVVGTFNNSAAFVLCGPIGSCGTQNFYPSGSTLTMTTTGGTCNPFTETTTGCGIINVTVASDGIDIVNGANVTVTNLAVMGPAVVPLNNFGIHAVSTLPAYTSSAGVTITNNIVSNFGYDIVMGTLGGSGASTVTGYVMSDNWVTSATHVNPGPLACMRGDAGTQGIMQGNLATQCGGQSGNNGNGIMTINYPAPASGTTTMQFNTNHDFGWNDAPNSGGPVGVYVIGADKVLVQFNESYNGIPNPAFYNGSNAIDFDCFDVDNGSTNVTVQYNYAHNCPVQGGFNIVDNTNQNPNWTNNTIRYNIAENVQECFPIFGNATTTNSFIYNNTCATNVASNPVFPLCWNGPQPIVVANNLCIWTGSVARAYVNIAYNSLPLPSGMIWLNNDYFATASSPSWIFNKIFQSPTLYSTLAAFQTATIDVNHASGLDANSLNVNPMLAGTPGTAGTCYTDASGSPPAGPQPCPNNIYQLTTGSPLIGVGLDLTHAPYSQNVGTRDYFGTAIPNGVGSGYNIGADGAHH